MKSPTEWVPDGKEEGQPIEIFAKDEFGTLEAACISGFCDARHISAKSGIVISDADLGELIREMGDYLPKELAALYRLVVQMKARSIHLLYPHTEDPEGMNVRLCKSPYSRDSIGVVDNIAILATLEEMRQDERQDFASIFERLPETHRFHNEEISPWGNILLHDDTILIGTFNVLAQSCGRALTARENSVLESMARGRERLREILTKTSNGRKIVEVELARFTDLDLAITPLPKKKAGERSAVLVSPDVTDQGHAALAKVFDDALRCNETTKTKGYNVLWLDPETPVVSEESTQVRPILQGQGHNVIPIPVQGMLAKTDFDTGALSGGWRCTVGPLRRAKDYTF